MKRNIDIFSVCIHTHTHTHTHSKITMSCIQFLAVIYAIAFCDF